MFFPDENRDGRLVSAGNCLLPELRQSPRRKPKLSERPPEAVGLAVFHAFGWYARLWADVLCDSPFEPPGSSYTPRKCRAQLPRLQPLQPDPCERPSSEERHSEHRQGAPGLPRMT